MEGQLLKKTKGGKWLPRYFKIYNDGTENVLSWLKSDNKTTITIKLANAEVRDIKFGTRKFAFEIISPERTVSLAAAGEAEKQAWLSSVESASGARKTVVGSKVGGGRSQAAVAAQAVANATGGGAKKTPGKIDSKKVDGIASVLGLAGGKALSSDAEDALKAKLGNKFANLGKTDTCTLCGKNVYPTERMAVDKQVVHKMCFRCDHCHRQLTLSNFAAVNSKFFCKPHYLELFAKAGGKYTVFGDAGFKMKSGPQNGNTSGDGQDGGSPSPKAKARAESSTRSEKSREGRGEEEANPAAEEKESSAVAREEDEAPQPEHDGKDGQEKAHEETAQAGEAEEEELPMFRPPPVATFAAEAMKKRAEKLGGKAPAAEIVVESPGRGHSASKSDGNQEEAEAGDGIGELKPLKRNDEDASSPGVMTHKQMSRPSITARRRAPKRMDVGKMLPPPEIGDKTTHEFSFRVETGDASRTVLVMHASSLIEKDKWVQCLANAIYVRRLQHDLEVAQRVDMMSALEAQVAKESYETGHESTYAGYLEKLSIKSQRNWKKRYFELDKNGKLSYFANESSKKAIFTLDLTHFSVVKDSMGHRVEAEVAGGDPEEIAAAEAEELGEIGRGGAGEPSVTDAAQTEETRSVRASTDRKSVRAKSRSRGASSAPNSPRDGSGDGEDRDEDEDEDGGGGGDRITIDVAGADEEADAIPDDALTPSKRAKKGGKCVIS